MALAGGAADILSGIGILPHCKDVMLVDMASYRPPDELRMVMKELKNVGRNWKVSPSGRLWLQKTLPVAVLWHIISRLAWAPGWRLALQDCSALLYVLGKPVERL